MSDHADTIRRALADHGYPHDGVGCTYCQGATAALDALEAKLQQAIDALRRIGDDADRLDGYAGAGDFARSQLRDLGAAERRAKEAAALADRSPP